MILSEQELFDMIKPMIQTAIEANTASPELRATMVTTSIVKLIRNDRKTNAKN